MKGHNNIVYVSTNSNGLYRFLYPFLKTAEQECVQNLSKKDTEHSSGKALTLEDTFHRSDTAELTVVVGREDLGATCKPHVSHNWCKGGGMLKQRLEGKQARHIAKCVLDVSRDEEEMRRCLCHAPQSIDHPVGSRGHECPILVDANRSYDDCSV